jgi:hypothetical protein
MNEMMLMLGILRLNIRNYIDTTQHIIKSKEKTHMIISVTDS